MRAIVIVLAVLILSSSSVFAQEATFSATYSAQMSPTGNDIGVSKITPASFLYFLKTVRENLEMKLALTPHVKKIRQLEFATRRLRETKGLVGTQEELIQPTLERYWSHISRLSDKELQDSEIAIRVKETLTVHLEVLQQIYGKITNKSAKMSTRAMINRIVQRTDVPLYARFPACKFLQKEATSSALTEAEKEILLHRADNCFEKNLDLR